MRLPIQAVLVAGVRCGLYKLVRLHNAVTLLVGTDNRKVRVGDKLSEKDVEDLVANQAYRVTIVEK